MLEIFAIPYIFVTGWIGWLIFEPLVRIDEPQPLTRAKIVLSDLLSVTLPVSVLAASAKLLIPESSLSLTVQLIVITFVLVFVALAFAAGLYLIPKRPKVSLIKRTTVIAVIAPFGSLLTLGWIGFLTWACVYSVMYLAPAMVVVGAATQGLRMLTLWVCQGETKS